jgi:hypothetical protein
MWSLLPPICGSVSAPINIGRRPAVARDPTLRPLVGIGLRPISRPAGPIRAQPFGGRGPQTPLGGMGAGGRGGRLNESLPRLSPLRGAGELTQTVAHSSAETSRKIRVSRHRPSS